MAIHDSQVKACCSCVQQLQLSSQLTSCQGRLYTHTGVSSEEVFRRVGWLRCKPWDAARSTQYVQMKTTTSLEYSCSLVVQHGSMPTPTNCNNNIALVRQTEGVFFLLYIYSWSLAIRNTSACSSSSPLHQFTPFNQSKTPLPIPWYTIPWIGLMFVKIMPTAHSATGISLSFPSPRL